MKETKFERQRRFYDRLSELGFTFYEANQLRRIEMTLHRWAEHECNGNIQRDGENGEGKPFWVNSEPSRYMGGRRDWRCPIADRERGALKRLGKIIGDRNTRNWREVYGPIQESPGFLLSHHQGDPRGCALYLVRKSDIRAGESIGSVYSRGVAVCF